MFAVVKNTGPTYINTTKHRQNVLTKRCKFIFKTEKWLICKNNKQVVFDLFVAWRGAHLAAERGGAERRHESEAQPNGEGVASGSATQICD